MSVMVEDAMAAFDPVLGLGCVELNTASKMFCGCANEPAQSRTPDLPGLSRPAGSLPVVNAKAIESAIRSALR